MRSWSTSVLLDLKTKERMFYISINVPERQLVSICKLAVRWLGYR